MDGTFRSVGISLALLTLIALEARADTRLRPTDLPDGFWRQASQLQPTRLKLSQIEALQNRKAPPSLDVLVVGCDFSDSLMWGRDLADFPGWPAQRRRSTLLPGTDIDEFAAHDSTYFDLQMRKVADYFSTVSFGAFTLNWDVHGEIVNLGLPMGYYGDIDSSDVRVVAMAQAVIDSIDAEVDFSAYDTVVLIHAGAGQETDVLGNSPQQIFSNYLDVRDFQAAVEAGLVDAPALVTGEGDLLHALILPESESQDSFPEAGFSGFFGTRGVYCFEFGLRLGMINMGDFTPAGFPDSQGIGNFGLMGFGLFTGLGIVPSAPCAFNRWLMGWVPAVEVRDNADIRLGAMGAAGDAVSDTLLVKIPIDDRQYFLVEYRLQDPDGDLFFTFDDLNANHVPDYYDFDSAFGDGHPTSTFDPATDTWESTLGGEWDWFMSENTVRSDDRCQRAGGSGLYIWHVDERVIQHAVDSGLTIANADPSRSGVDVEEADGIQDLDSRENSPYFLGWDGDAWRGAFAEFGPDTNPSTDTADGLPTGIRIDQISHPVISQLPLDGDGNCTGFIYRAAMTFRVSFGDASGPDPVAAHRFVDAPARGDVRLVDLGTTAGDPTPDDILEVVLGGDEGRLYAFHGDLSEWVDGDADVATLGVLAIATEVAPIAGWIGAPAIGDVDDDGVADVIASSVNGIHAFSAADGSELRDGDTDAATHGPLWSPASGELVGPPLLVGDTSDPTAPPYSIVQLVFDAGETRAYRLDATGGTLGVVTGTAVPRRANAAGGSLMPSGDGGWRVVYGWNDGAATGIASIDLDDFGTAVVTETDAGFADVPLLSFAFRPGSPEQLAWVDSLGAANAIELTGGERTLGSVHSGPWTGLSGGSDAGTPLLAYAAGERLVSLDRNLSVRDGFPYRPGFEGVDLRSGVDQSAPLLLDLNADGRTDLLWHDPVGRIHAVGSAGNPLSGYPFAGPAEPTGAMAVGDVDGDTDLDLVVLGRFEAIASIDVPAQETTTRAQGEVRVYDLGVGATASATWTQGRGGALQQSYQALDLRSGGVAVGGSILAEGSLWLAPNPARGEELRVRVTLLRAATVRATLYNLEGEEVATTGDIAAVGGASVDEALPIEHLVSGFYLCRVQAGDEIAIKPFTVVK